MAWVHKSYIKSEFDYELSISEGTMKVTLYHTQIIQHFSASMIFRYHDYTNTPGVDLVERLVFQAMAIDVHGHIKDALNKLIIP